MLILPPGFETRKNIESLAPSQNLIALVGDRSSGILALPFRNQKSGGWEESNGILVPWESRIVIATKADCRA